MKTNLMKKNNKMVPAGIVKGTEAFWYDGGKWLIHNGHSMKFEDAPAKVQRTIAVAFMQDKKSREYLRRIGADAFSKAFDMWYHCIVGALDETPDFVDGNLNADAYNSACSDFQCPHRGKFCSLGPALKNYEVATIKALKQGETIEHTADLLFISVAGLKSRIEKVKEKMGAKNMASLIAKASDFGI